MFAILFLLVHIYISFVVGNEGNNFQLAPEGKLTVLKNLDREKEPSYSLIVKASSNRNWSPRKAMRASRIQSFDPSTDSTLQEVRIYLEDINDQPPRFTKTEYTAGNRFFRNTEKQQKIINNFANFPLYSHIIMLYFLLQVLQLMQK